jgi:hypothetical protein
MIWMHNETFEIIIAHSPFAIEGSCTPTIWYKGEYLGFTYIGEL